MEHTAGGGGGGGGCTPKISSRLAGLNMSHENDYCGGENVCVCVCVIFTMCCPKAVIASLSHYYPPLLHRKCLAVLTSTLL